MKQNERLLVYAVTGFLALILVIAVLFGNEPAKASSDKESTSPGLSEILNRKKAPDSGAGAGGDGSTLANGTLADGARVDGTPANGAPANGSPANRSAANGGSSEQPLMARPQDAAALVARTLGPSRRDRIVRFVRAKRGDAFETLVRRWCGSTEPFLKEALCLNEDTRMLREGQEVAVPWVDNEVLAALIEKQQTPPARTLVPPPAAGTPAAGTPAAGTPSAGTPSAGTPSAGTPSFLVPGSRPSSTEPAGGSPAAAAPSVSYTVKPGDSLWKLAASRYGKRNADRMIRTIKDLNPGLTDSLRIDQVILLPPKTL